MAILSHGSAGFGISTKPFRNNEIPHPLTAWVCLQLQATLRHTNEQMDMKTIRIRALLNCTRGQSHSLVPRVMGAKQLGIDPVQHFADFSRQVIRSEGTSAGKRQKILVGTGHNCLLQHGEAGQIIPVNFTLRPCRMGHSGGVFMGWVMD
ncbi:hypothetical protein OB03_01655 [Brevundimonas sp. GN22]